MSTILKEILVVQFVIFSHVHEDLMDICSHPLPISSGDLLHDHSGSQGSLCHAVVVVDVFLH